MCQTMPRPAATAMSPKSPRIMDHLQMELIHSAQRLAGTLRRTRTQQVATMLWSRDRNTGQHSIGARDASIVLDV